MTKELVDSADRNRGADIINVPFPKGQGQAERQQGMFFDIFHDEVGYHH